MSLVTFLRWFVLGGVLFWVVVYWRGGRSAIEDIERSVKSKNSHLDTPLMIVILLLSLVVIGTGLLIVLRQLPTDSLHSEVITVLGFVLSMLGIAGMFYCRRFLGRFWTAETNIIAGHEVVDQGPYKIVRHPIYTFAITLYWGLGLTFPVEWNLLAVGAITFAYALKAWDEDKFLDRSLHGYHEYRQRVRHRLFAGVW